MKIDGRQIAREVLARTRVRAARLLRPPRVVAVVVDETPATQSYMKIKGERAIESGCVCEVVRLAREVNTDELCESVRSLSEGVDAIIVQLPLPPHIDWRAVCNSIPLEKDADCLSTGSRARSARVLPPVAAAVCEICAVASVNLAGKRAVVVGDGWLVGRPCRDWLREAGALVTTVTLETSEDNRLAALRDAEIIISGAGAPHAISPSMIPEGVVLIDAGTSESSGKIVGDADPLCAEACSLFTPVPGGVGPIAVACLFENVVTLTEFATYQ